MKYGFIGFGNLAKAIYQGLKDEPELTFAYHSKSKMDQDIRSFETLQELVSYADVIWLCIKPQDLPEILTQLKEIPLKNKIIVSPVAGKKVSFIETYLGKEKSILRIMPNLAVAYQKSVTAVFTNHENTPNMSTVKSSLSRLGKVVELSEEQFDLFTAIFGSGPAFLLTIMQVLKNKIGELGVSELQGNDLLIELILGTLSYFNGNRAQKSMEDLIKEITSKGGTTEAGLNYLKENNLSQLFENIIIAAKDRSKEIGG